MCKTIKQKVKFKASPKTIYNFLAAGLPKKIGNRFSTNSDSVSGVTVDLVPGKRIVLAWREKRFPVGVFSMAAINLTPTKAGTELVLIHRGVPKTLIPKIETFWRDKYWRRAKKVFSE